MLIIDTGHGGSDPGAVRTGAKEKDLALEISLYQYNRFKELGYPVKMTRTTDKSLGPAERTRLVRNSGAKYCFSNHINAGGGNGAEVIHSIHNDGILANNILNEMIRAGQNKRKAFSRKGSNGKDYYFMHRDTGSVTTLIIEYGFIDSNDYYDFDTKAERGKLAEAVVRAFCQYVGHKYTPPGKTADKPAQGQIKPPSSQGKLYRVQIGAFSKKENAVSMMNKAMEKGFKALVTRDSGLYKTQTGAFSKKANAEALMKQLKEKGFSAFIEQD